MDFRLGDRVSVKARLVPRKTWGGQYSSYLLRRWVREGVAARGVVAGVRVVFEGKTDLQHVFTPERSIKTYLVAINMREIWHVLPEDMKGE